MPRKRVIVSIGEALLCEFPDRVELGGLALRCAIYARRLGHVGIPISRIGQDETSDELLELLRELEVDTSHIQSDPDHATGRRIIRSIGGKTSQTLQPRAAFDNLQWDFDLVDVAQQADAIIFGELARRGGLSRSIIKRFLAECTNAAVRLFDLTNRIDTKVDRSEARTGLESADAVVVDKVALEAMAPGWDGNDMHEAMRQILKKNNLLFGVCVELADCIEKMTIHTIEGSFASNETYPSGQHEAAVVGLLHGVLSGWEFPKCLEGASLTATQSAKRPNGPITIPD